MIDMTTLSQMASATSMSDAMAIRDSSLKIPNESESMLIQLNRGKDSYQDNEFSSIIYFEDGAFMPETVELLPGRYNISVQLFVNQEVTIPEERDRICAESVVGSCKKVELFDPCPDKENCYIIARCDEDETLGLGGCSLDKEVILTEIILPLVPSNGGVVYDDWHLTDYNYLDNGDNLTIYLFRQDIPERHSDLSDLGKYEVYSETYRYALEPEIR